MYHSCDDWVQHWIHTGHLHLKGQNEKMSKSIGNTITISELLNDYSSDQFRMACLLSHYRTSLEFGTELMGASEAILKRLQSFTSDVKAFVNGLKIDGYVNEEELIKKFKLCRKNIDESLRDDFHTAECIGHISDLMRTVSKMINPTETNYQTQPSSNGNDKALLLGVVNYIGHILKIFGINDEKSTKSCDELQMENLINTIVKVRNEIRLKAKDTKSKDLFQACDDIRNSMKANQIEIKDHGNLSSWSKMQ